MLCRFFPAIVALALLVPSVTPHENAGPQDGSDRSGGSLAVYTQTINVDGSNLQVDFAAGTLEVSREKIVERVQTAARAVAGYYGKFPVARVRILILPVAGRHGVLQGTTWGDRDGFPAFVRLRIGESTTPQELAADWIMTHELTHTALSSLPDDQHWLEEGLASYVEPIARAQAGDLTTAEVWGGMVRGMNNGKPEAGDRGLNHTHTWGRTYWGGALFCLMADLEIRKQTGNKKGLQDALRSIVVAGGTINTELPVSRLLAIGDQATGTKVLQMMYAQWSEKPIEVDLAELWKQLGIRMDKNIVTFDPEAPSAVIRSAITEPIRYSPR